MSAPLPQPPGARSRDRSFPAAWTLVAMALALAFWSYRPSVRAPFVFDDSYLPFALPAGTLRPMHWLLGVRPVLMFTYLVNFYLSGAGTFSYHLFNVALHCLNSALVFAIVHRLVRSSGIEKPRSGALAAFAALVFLFHPGQTEVVAYVAGRSDALSAFFVFAAYAVFLNRQGGHGSWRVAVAVLLLFLAAALSKEQAVALPALLLLTDWWWNPDSPLRAIRNNWRIYGLQAIAGAVALALFWDLIAHAKTAGFALADFTWYQYFFTQWRALFVYLGIFLLPVNLTADWDFPVSRSPTEHGAILWLLVLIALAVAAWCCRSRFRLASFGFLAYLVMLAPTSSILPIQDVVVERRLYSGMLPLLLILTDVLGRPVVSRRTVACAAVAAALLGAIATRARAQVWSSAISLWEDTARKSPNKMRVHFQLASAYYEAGRCEAALAEFEKAARLTTPRHDLLVDWALAYDCAGRPDMALSKLRLAASIDATAHVYSQIAKVHGQRGQWTEAMDALATAERIDGTYPIIYYYRGMVYQRTNQPGLAAAEYRRALGLQPDFPQASQGLRQSESALRQPAGVTLRSR